MGKNSQAHRDKKTFPLSLRTWQKWENQKQDIASYKWTSTVKGNYQVFEMDLSSWSANKNHRDTSILRRGQTLKWESRSPEIWNYLDHEPKAVLSKSLPFFICKMWIQFVYYRKLYEHPMK